MSSERSRRNVYFSTSLQKFGANEEFSEGSRKTTMKVQVCRKKSQRRRDRLRRMQEAAQAHDSCADILSLPQDVLLHMFKGLHIKDLLNLRSSHPHFRALIDSHATLWSTAAFQDVWPTMPNLKHFKRSAEQGNLEALIKLGVAYLYNEGLCQDFRTRKITSNGEHAAEMFSLVERLTPGVVPFTWLFIRPPWATTGACCKECVFKNMLNIVKARNESKMHICIAKIYQLLDEQTDSGDSSRTEKHLTAATGNLYASFLHWQIKYKNMLIDTAKTLEGMRQLRNIAGFGQNEAVYELCRLYVQGHYGGTSRQQAASHVTRFIQSSQPTNLECIFKKSELTPSMRYILMDWLVEVASMKDFCSPTLHCAISVVDRYLKIHPTTRSKLQLLGVAAMVLCSRFLGRDIITIREAAWLTDNTYKYEDVVRMMGEITATLHGHIKVFNSLDYVLLLGLLVHNDKETQCLSEYIVELSLLQSELGVYPPAQIAAAAVLLARLTKVKEYPWPSQMKEFTGYNMEDIAKCAVHVHFKCFKEEAFVDHRDIVLQAVKQRYNEEGMYSVSKTEMVSYVELQSLLGFSEEASCNKQMQFYFSNIIQSPSRSQSKSATKMSELSSEREQAATPTLEKRDINWNQLNESIMSGYEGDKEDEDESFFEREYDSDPDLESLWCADSPKKGTANQQSLPKRCAETNDSDGSFSSSRLKATESEPDSPTLQDSPAKFFSPSIRINLPSYAAFSSTPNLSSPSWQKIASANGDQSFSFSFDLDNSSIKNSDNDHGWSLRHNQSIDYGKSDAQSSAIQNGAPHIVLHMSPSVDSGIDVSLRSNHTSITEQSQSSTMNGSFFTVPSTSVSSVLSSVIPPSSRVSVEPTTPNRYRRPSGLVPLESMTKSMPSRSALVSITNTTPCVANSSTCANVNSTMSAASTSKGKRKSSHDMGNENKTRVLSP